MLTIHLITRSGIERALAVTPGHTLMETLREAGVDEPTALCGGCCSCATCHVYVGSHQDALPPLGDDEDQLLDSSDAREGRSRLSCHIPLSAALDGLRVTIAPED
ncbi:MAG: (2Fe-2S)-binding protein [Sphingopyxis sp.]|nr:(2Fe-2S)-binding protein [Sphingopyxis sp.]